MTSLETYQTPDELYLYRGDEVNPNRPELTGDVFAEISIPGLEGIGLAVVVTHPCAMRRGMALNDRVMMARVRESEDLPPKAWLRHHFDKAPLPDLVTDGHQYVACLDQVGLASSQELTADQRIACLSPFGVNLLQQRLIWHLTRFCVPTPKLQESIEHILEEAELQEEWNDTLVAAGLAGEAVAQHFEDFMSEAGQTGKPRRDCLRDSQLRPEVRRALRKRASRLAEM